MVPVCCLFNSESTVLTERCRKMVMLPHMSASELQYAQSRICETGGSMYVGWRNESCCVQLAEPLPILFSLRDTNTEQRGAERLPAAKLFSQLSRHFGFSFFICLLKPLVPDFQMTHCTHTCTSVAACCDQHVLLLDCCHYSVKEQLNYVDLCG